MATATTGSVVIHICMATRLTQGRDGLGGETVEQPKRVLWYLDGLVCRIVREGAAPASKDGLSLRGSDARSHQSSSSKSSPTPCTKILVKQMGNFDEKQTRNLSSR